jgi:secreted trypsin-like serine protease
MRKLAALAAGVTAALAMAGSTPAQTGDAQLDGTRHPNVGALLAKRTDGSLGIICSGTLVSPRVFLTAGHCTDFMFSLGQFDAFVTFDPNFGTDPLHNIFSTPFHGALVQNPSFHVPAQNDTALVLLDVAVTGIAPAKIAPLGFLDGLRDAGTIQTTKFTNVGYGTSEQVVVPGTGPIFPGDGIRKFTVSGFYSLTPEYIHLNQNLKQGYSGTCFGDSGGPTFVSAADGPVVISVVSAGDNPCYTLSVDERLDIANAQQFLAPYLTLP